MKVTMNWTIPLRTSAGEFLAGFSSEGLAQLDFPGVAMAKTFSLNDDELPGKIVTWGRQTEQALGAALDGRPPKELPPLDWSGSTDFQRRVWQALLRIPCGKTRTYADVANEIGSPAATRAVGSACGANPIPVLVPCHRVLASGGALGGFSGGLDWKRRLLKVENAATPFELKT
jgi:O-6-methylguanine DNA methyltransferase